MALNLGEFSSWHDKAINVTVTSGLTRGKSHVHFGPYLIEVFYGSIPFPLSKKNFGYLINVDGNNIIFLIWLI